MRFWITDAESSNIDDAFNFFRDKAGLKQTEALNLQAISPLQREVLAVLGSSDSKPSKVFSNATRKLLATSLGISGVIASATLTRALADLEKRGLVTKVSRGEYLATLGVRSISVSNA